MFLNKKFFLLLIPVVISAYAEAQTVKVKKEKSTVKGESMEGHAVELQGTLAEVNTAFIRFLKTYGKVKQNDFITLSEPNLNGLTFIEPLYATSNENGKTATAWIGFNNSSWKKEDADKANKELEHMMHDFGIKFYRDKIQVQVDESERATQAVEKQKQRLLSENKSLSTKLENNKKQKIQLEKSLENNKTENQELLKRIEQNKKAQDSVAVAAEQIKKVVEMHKERQRKVN
jgi:hypothetical protein